MKQTDEPIRRFGPRDRIEHALVMLIFLVLALTGLPQKFHELAFSHWLVELLGGIERVRWLHRFSGWLFAGLVFLHLSSVTLRLLRGRSSLAMVPSLRDFQDAIQMVRYHLGAAQTPPPLEHFDYREKFEYWGMVLGGVIMISTGLALMFPVLATHVLPGELIPAAKVAHSNEGLLAMLVLITWHLYHVLLAPGVFPLNKSMFTGTISKHHLKRDHALEYERLFPDETKAEPEPEPDRTDEAKR